MPSTANNAGTPLRLAVIGLANHYNAYGFARELAAGIPGLEFVGVAAPRAEQAQDFASRFGLRHWATSPEELVANTEVDAVIISSSTVQHADHVEFAAAHGKPVLLEKPIATNLADAARIVTAARATTLMMAYTLPELPAAKAAEEAIRTGEIGRPLSAVYTTRVPIAGVEEAPGAGRLGWYGDAKQSGGGAFIDHGVIFADFLRRLMGSDACSVSATMANVTDADLAVEDYGIATYRLHNGCIITIESTWHAPQGIGPLADHDRCRITGSLGELVLTPSGSPQLEIQTAVGHRPHRRSIDFSGRDRYDVSLRNTLLVFRDVVRGEAPNPCTVVDGLRTLEMMVGAYESSRSGRRVELAAS